LEWESLQHTTHATAEQCSSKMRNNHMRSFAGRVTASWTSSLCGVESRAADCSAYVGCVLGTCRVVQGALQRWVGSRCRPKCKLQPWFNHDKSSYHGSTVQYPCVLMLLLLQRTQL
jgi:hypothetical protein